MNWKFYTFFMILIMSYSTNYSQSWVWASPTGGTSYDLANDIYTDADGNSYITGWYQNTVNFGADTLTSMGGYDFYVAKYNSSGICQWVRGTGSSMNDIGYGVVADASGNVYVTGTYWNTVFFDSFSLTSSGGADVFVAKYNSAGVCQWALTGGAPIFSEQGQAITLDGQNNVIINGYFMGTATFGTTTFTSYGNSDVFTAKINSSGVWQWAVRGGSANGDNGYGVSCDANNNIYITGYFRSTATFGTQTITSAGTDDIYIVKYNATGVCQWAKAAGGINDDHGNGIVSDASGNVYLTGWFKSGTINFGSISITAANSTEEAFVAKYDSNGTPLWAVNIGSASTEIGTGICLDISGNPIISGTYQATFTIGTTTIPAFAGGDFFIAKFNSNTGSNVWATYAGGSGNDVAYKLSSDNWGNIYCAGSFYSTCYFGTDSITSMGIADIFLAKIDPTITEIPDNIYVNNSNFLLFPNPTCGKTNLNINLTNDENLFLLMFNTYGKLVGKWKLKNGCNQIKSAELPGGTYLYQLSSKEKIIKTGKLILL